MPVFSVIIPLYNKAAYISHALASVAAQLFTDYEVIVVNDGSTDASGQIVKQVQQPNIIYVETANRGASAARNTGIKLANGGLIAFLDADDEWMPNHLEELYRLYNSYPTAGMLALRYYIKNPGTSTLQKPVFDGLADDFTGIVPNFFASGITNRVACSTSIAIPQHVFKTTGVFNEAYTNMEDMDMWVRIGIYYPVALGSSYTSIYNFHIGESLSKTSLSLQKIMDFTAYAEAEKHDTGLHAFLNMYRLEYALKYRTIGYIQESRALLKQVTPNEVPLSKKILLNLPPFILRLMLGLKKMLYKRGIRLGK